MGEVNNKKKERDNESKEEIVISAISEENTENEKSCSDDEKYTNFKSLDLDDPNKWPSIDEKLRLYLIECEPCQINMETFPINTRGRSFSSFHYFRRLPNGERIKRSWIIYSKSSDSVFCFCCKLFNIGVVSLTTNGNNDWKNISNILNRHETSTSHKKAYQNWKELETRCKRGKTIDNINEANLKIETEHWKNILRRIIELIKTLSSQNLAFRGKSDKLNSPNNGNFLKFIEFLSKFDPVMKEHIRRISSQEIHCHYLGKDIQNEVIQLLANKIRFRIITALKNVKYYSIILDCTPDINHTEQMTVIVRFVSTTENETTSKIEHVSINEHFIGFIELHNTTGLNMTEVILQKLRELDISLDDMRGQGYDNGANMRGYKNGVQARI
ncbi:zinc finger MYM-type protein 1-like [Aphis gossypii]|uniref:zinc finger MYM-type protein 1-like n=1 Tax=Aphis gossypii TaxID=80765 RepID=UPI002159983F|nr:zinc finger MYM-type protein 1-like [Aphis gossypii]XP_050066065.1 zinc finger MYM-type protein 1-like [Aphis gossypii]